MAEQSSPDLRALARLIDHTLLKPEAGPADIERLCAEALQYGFASVCVNPVYVRLCMDRLQGQSEVVVCAVIGFPLGATTTEVKVFEAQRALADGAAELDMVQHVGALRSGELGAVERDIAAVVSTAHAQGALCKVILETALLNDAEKVTACRIAQAAGADFVKTSTGFGPGGATVADVALMRRTVGPTLGVKASGGIRTYADVQQMVAAGANRIGASAGVRIIQEALGEGAAGGPAGAY